MTKKAKRYNIDEKENLTKRMLPPINCPISQLSAETGISTSTLSTWKTKALRGQSSRDVGRPKSSLSSRDKFIIVMETYTLSEVELAKYCRENGLYLEDIKNWRESCMGANNPKSIKTINPDDVQAELNQEKKKTKELQKELSVKEKALAETAALLVLRKKLNAIFEENEDD